MRRKSDEFGGGIGGALKNTGKVLAIPAAGIAGGKGLSKLSKLYKKLYMKGYEYHGKRYDVPVKDYPAVKRLLPKVNANYMHTRGKYDYGIEIATEGKVKETKGKKAPMQSYHRRLGKYFKAKKNMHPNHAGEYDIANKKINYPAGKPMSNIAVAHELGHERDFTRIKKKQKQSWSIRDVQDVGELKKLEKLGKKVYTSPENKHHSKPGFSKRYYEHVIADGTLDNFFNLSKMGYDKDRDARLARGDMGTLKYHDETKLKRINLGREVGVKPFKKYKPKAPFYNQLSHKVNNDANDTKSSKESSKERNELFSYPIYQWERDTKPDFKYEKRSFKGIPKGK